MASDTEITSETVPSSPAAFAPPPPPSTDPPEQPITLDEFTLGYAHTAEVETMGAFRAGERAAGRLADKASAYLARIASFLNEQH